jgi:alpha,alpha-trehalase
MTLDYGIIGNCRTAALIKKNGSMGWCCFPHFDSQSVFAKIIDEEKGGSFEIQPIGKYKISQKYISSTNVLETAYYNGHHSFKIIDFFKRYKYKDKIIKDNKIYRLIKVTKGKPKARIIYNPKLNYAKGRTTLRLHDKHISASNKHHELRLYSNMTLKSILKKKVLDLQNNTYFIITFDEDNREYSARIVNRRLNKTVKYWKTFIQRLTIPKFYKKNVVRSALTLKLLTYEDTGAVVAAATTSIPEIIGGQRNYDYRYCWLRDSSFTINALTRMCSFGASIDYMKFLRSIALGSSISKKDGIFDMQIMYSINGGKKLTEKVMKHLSGYENSRPVRIGNSAYKQKQLDVAGEVIDTIHEFYVHYSYVEHLDDSVWHLVVNLVNYVIGEWKKKDNGIWEFRAKREHFTFSKLMAWVALDKAIEISKFHKREQNLEQWNTVRDEIRKDIEDNAWSEEKQAFTMFYGGKDLDASVLLMPYYGFIKATHQRMKKTILAAEKELSKEGLVMRYTMEDDFGKPSNAFTICTFWFIDALYMAGYKNKAKNIFRNVLRYSNHLGLFSEDIDLKTKQLTGNFPQAYTHIALINTAALLSEKGLKRPVCQPFLK